MLFLQHYDASIDCYFIFLAILRMMDSWRSIVGMKEAFLLPGVLQPSVLAFCPEDNDYINSVIKAGADHAGSKEMIKLIQV